MNHPIQPIEVDESGVLRFKQNKIVSFLAEMRLNELCTMGFSNEDWEQLAQLIGYSLSGFGGLSYVSNETYNAAELMAEQGITEDKARIAELQRTVAMVKDGLKAIVPELFSIHPDDLE